MSETPPVSRVLRQALALLMRSLIGRLDWGRVRDTVLRLMDVDLDGADKRRIAIDELRTLGVTLGNALLHLAIEAAVVWADRHDPE